MWVEETSGPLVLAKHPPFNHPSVDLLEACWGCDNADDVVEERTKA
jgi:hypothetical protein